MLPLMTFITLVARKLLGPTQRSVADQTVLQGLQGVLICWPCLLDWGSESLLGQTSDALGCALR